MKFISKFISITECEEEQKKRASIENELQSALDSKYTSENKIAMLSGEIERLQYKLNNKNTEADDLKKKLS